MLNYKFKDNYLNKLNDFIKNSIDIFLIIGLEKCFFDNSLFDLSITLLFHPSKQN